MLGSRDASHANQTHEPASAQGAATEPPRARRAMPYYPVLIEVAGCLDDEIVHDVTQRLRRYRNRYQPLLRCMFTLVATSLPEAQLFGDDAAAASEAPHPPSSATAGPLFTAPKSAVSINKTHSLIRRFYSHPQVHTRPLDGGDYTTGAVPTALLGSLSGTISQPCWTEGPVTTALHKVTTTADCHNRAVRRLEDFMAFHFLPLAMTHNCPTPPASASASDNTFVLRHYVNEASRTSSFLLADPFCTSSSVSAVTLTSAAIVDPRAEQLNAYVSDLSCIGATLCWIIFTHCYVDGATGLAELLERFPTARVLSGIPLAPAGTAEDAQLSSRLRLRTVRVPAFSPESLLVEIYLSDVLVGLCTGVLWGTDAAPRWDLLQWSAFPGETTDGPLPPSSSIYGIGGDRDAALVHTYGVLKKYVFDVYFLPLCAAGGGPREAGGGAATATRADEAVKSQEGGASGVAADRDALQRVVLLPTHGGYSNVTSQLDLYWAAHLGDLTRMRHSRAVIDTLATTAEAFAKYSKRLPRLPHPLSFDTSRVVHLRQLLALLQPEHQAACVERLPDDMQQALRYTFDPSVSGGESLGVPRQRLAFLSSYVNLVDVRNATDYHALHLCGAINVPMSFPGVAYGASRAELWLQCVLVPFRPIVALCATKEQRAEVSRRLSALSPESRVHVFTLADLPCPSETPTVHSAESAPTIETKLSWREVRCNLIPTVSSDMLPFRTLHWIQRDDALSHLTSYEHLAAIEPADTRVVLDVRTPYEFKNGSHQHSVHVELAELCVMAVKDAAAARPPPSEWHCSCSPGLADAYMERIHTTALVAGLPVVRQAFSLSDVTVYCAGGYRSLIALSLLQRAMEASTTPAWRSLRMFNVSGGAFQIMTQRPDLWQVKDRSIICIS